MSKEREDLNDWMNRNIDKLRERWEFLARTPDPDDDKRREDLHSFNKSWQNWAEQNNVDPYPPTDSTDRKRGKF